MADETTIPRRRFLAQAAALGAVAGAGILPAALQPAARAAAPGAGIEQLTLGQFRPLVGESFRVVLPGARLADIRLTAVTGLRAPTGKGTDRFRREPFSLLFRGRPGLTQDTYRVNHPAIGAHAVFLVSVERPDQGLYEAVFT